MHFAPRSYLLLRTVPQRLPVIPAALLLTALVAAACSDEQPSGDTGRIAPDRTGSGECTEEACFDAGQGSAGAQDQCSKDRDCPQGDVCTRGSCVPEPDSSESPAADAGPSGSPAPDDSNAVMQPSVDPTSAQPMSDPPSATDPPPFDGGVDDPGAESEDNTDPDLTTDPGMPGVIGGSVDGGSDDPPIESTPETPPAMACEEFTPCGGNVVGVWDARSSCLTVTGEIDLSGIGLGCSSAPVKGFLEVTGSLALEADGSYSDLTTTRGEQELTLAPQCLEISGTVTTCERISAPLTSYGYSSVDCVSAADGGCVCNTTVDQVARPAFVSFRASGDGIYSTVGDELTLADGRNETEYAYCVAGESLRLSLLSQGLTGMVSGQIEFRILE